jgi:hypothetical protein
VDFANAEATFIFVCISHASNERCQARAIDKADLAQIDDNMGTQFRNALLQF